MLRLSSLSCELRRCVAGALLSIPLVAAATAPQETFLPPQQIPLPGTMIFSKLVVADVNGDGYDDIVAIGSDTDGLVLDVYLNDGKPRRSAEDVTFVKQRTILKAHTDTDAAADKVRFSGGLDLQVTDLDKDGYSDILASFAGSGEIFILWNQGPGAPKPFVYTPDTSDPAATSMTVMSPFALDALGLDTVLGTPVYVAAANLGDGSGRQSIVAYHASLQPYPSTDSRSKASPPFNQRNYEAIAIFYPAAGSSRGFNFPYQRYKWPSDCDMSLGSTCSGWNDGMPAVLSDADLLYNVRAADQLRLNFQDAASDTLSADRIDLKSDGSRSYVAATIRPNASSGLQVLPGSGPGGSDSVWLQGGGKANEFVANNGLGLMRRRTAIGAVVGNERSAGTTFGTLSATGQTPLITAGGMRVVYDPSNPASMIEYSVPDYLNRSGQIGAWLNWVRLDAGAALLSLSDYCRAPDPCSDQFYWYHLPLDGSPPPKYIFGGSRTLVMLDFAQEIEVAGVSQLAPFYQKPDEDHFQAFSIAGGPLDHKPFIASGHFASPSESALVMLDHTDGERTDTTWNHLSLYRPDTDKTYASPAPHLDGLAVGRFISMGLADVGLTLPQGEVSAVLVGTHLGADTQDGIRYVTVHDKTTGAMVGIFPSNQAEKIKELSEDGVVVPGLSTLPIGQYTLEVHNATAMTSMDLHVVNPFGVTTTDYDWRAGNTCGLLPNTKDGALWPKQIAVSVTDFPGTVEAIRWINQDDGSVVNLGSEGATYDATAKTVTLMVPQGKLKDGKWRASIKSNGVWQPVERTWNVTHDTGALAFCASQVNFVNEEAYAQCDNDNFFMDPAQYKVWPHLVNNGTVRFFGSGFGQNQVKSAAIKQGNHRYFNSTLQLKSDNEIDVEFGDLSASLAPDAEADVYFYSADGGTVEANGIPAVGGKQHWRTVRKGACVQSMPHYASISPGSGKDGAFQAGDVIEASGENLIYPVPTANRLILTDKTSGTKFALPPRLPDDFYSTHYDNTKGKLIFQIPNDEDWDKYKIEDGDGLVEGWAPPPYVSYIVEAGTSAATPATVSAGTAGGGILGGFTAGIYLSGNTPTGAATWIKGAVSSSAPLPGRPGDDQPEDQSSLWYANYISNDGGFDPKLYTVVFEATEKDWVLNLQNAIYQQGRGKYFNPTSVQPWPCGTTFSGGLYYATEACVVLARPIAASTAIGVGIPYVSEQYRLYVNSGHVYRWVGCSGCARGHGALEPSHGSEANRAVPMEKSRYYGRF